MTPERISANSINYNGNFKEKMLKNVFQKTINLKFIKY